MHKQGTQLRAKDSRMELVVLPVAHIFAFGLKSDVLPPDTVTVAAIVAPFVHRGVRLTAVSQTCKLATKPQNLTVDFCKPPAIAVLGPPQMVYIFKPSIKIRLSTHVQALVQRHGSQLVKDRGHVDGSTALFWATWGPAPDHQVSIPALILGCPSGRAEACIVSTHSAARGAIKFGASRRQGAQNCANGRSPMNALRKFDGSVFGQLHKPAIWGGSARTGTVTKGAGALDLISDMV